MRGSHPLCEAKEGLQAWINSREFSLVLTRYELFSSDDVFWTLEGKLPDFFFFNESITALSSFSFQNLVEMLCVMASLSLFLILLFTL